MSWKDRLIIGACLTFLVAMLVVATYLHLTGQTQLPDTVWP